MRARSETFYVTPRAPFVEVYLPKQGAKEVRPVRRVVIYERNNTQRDPYFFTLIGDKPALSFVTITMRDPQDRELIKDAPVTMFGESNTFGKPSLSIPAPIMHARRQLGPLTIDPQRTTVRVNAALPRDLTLALEFVYMD
jgi:hypothetical protein